MDFLRVNRCHIEQIEITVATQLLKWDRASEEYSHTHQQCDTRMGTAHEIDESTTRNRTGSRSMVNLAYMTTGETIELCVENLGSNG
jgi:hypothetical protein